MAGPVQAKKALTAAQKVLEGIPTAEKAVALKGAERAEYLKALDEVHGPAAERAKQMGFGEQTYYHGTDKYIDKFDPEKSKDVGTIGKGVYFAPKETLNLAEAYADSKKGGHIIPVRVNEGNMISADKTLTPGMIKKLKGAMTEDQFLARKGNADLEPGRTMVGDFSRRMARDEGYADTKKALEAAGIDTVRHVNREIMVLDPKNIRSINAAFDPRFKDSDLILAATGQSKGPKLANPANIARDAYDAYAGKLSAAAGSIADKLLETTTPQGLPGRQKFIDDNKPVVSFGTEMIADPLNFIAPGAGAIAKIAKSGKAASKIAEGLKIADKTPEAVQFAKEGFRVVNSGQPALETALAKSLRNPEAVIADIQSRGSLSAAEKARIIERIKPSPEAAAKLQKVEAGRINADPKQIKDQAHAYFEAIKNSN